MSLSASSSGSWSGRMTRSMPASAGRSVRGSASLASGGWPATREPKASASDATARPMEPRPTMPTVDVAHLGRGQRLPRPLALQLQQLGQPPDDGQHHHQHVLGDGVGEHAPRVGDDQAPIRRRRARAPAPRPPSRSGPTRDGARAQDAFERRRRQRAPEHHLDVVERPVREPLERDGDQPRSGRRGADAFQVRLPVARRQDGRQRDGGGHAAGSGAGHQVRPARTRRRVRAECAPGTTRSTQRRGSSISASVGSDAGPSHRWPMAASPPAA